MKPTKCAYQECERPALPDPEAQGYCILHAPWDDKDLNAFQAAIDDIIQEAPNNQNTCDFSGCYFPREYDCRNLQKALRFNCFFIRATFSGEAIFMEATFSGEAYFGGAMFSGEAIFEGAKFSREAIFRRATFSGEAIFGGATFSGAFADFVGATFLQRANFSYAKTDKSAVVWFSSVNCLKPQQVRFHHVDLSRWSFLNTDLRRIDFDDVTWASTRGFLSRRIALYDELTVFNKKDDLARVERLYRHLKQNYESQRDYGRAGDFYYGEMEMKRRQLHPTAQIPFWLYRLMSSYGESYVRALVVLIAMWLTFALLFTFLGYDEETGLSVQRYLTWDPSAWGETLADFARSLLYSAQSMTLFHEPNITFHSVWGQAIELVASILGVIQIALFGLALQRRFKR